MDLKRKFTEADVCRMIRVDQMEVDRKYPIIKAKRVYTKFGESVLLTIVDSTVKLVKVFFPKTYSSLFTAQDIESMKSKIVQLNLIYKGTCLNTNSHKLAI